MFLEGAPTAVVDGSTLSLALTDLPPNAGTTVDIQARDTQGNQQTQGLIGVVFTPDPSDVTPPSWPPGAILGTPNVTATTVSLLWPTPFDDAGLIGYRVFVDDVQVDALPPNANGYEVTGLQPSTTYTIRLEAGDNNGNWSTDGPTATITTGAASEPPTWPPGSLLTVQAVTATSVSLSWPGATDDVFVQAYVVYVDGTPGPETAGLAATIQNLTPETTYTFRVEARDGQQNESTGGPTAQATTLAPPDQTAPVWPPAAALTVTALGPESVAVSWPAASDAESGLAGYRIYVDGQLGAEVGSAVNSQVLTDLPAATPVAVVVQAFDAAGNETTDGPAADVTAPGDTLAPTWPPGATLSLDLVEADRATISWPAATDDVAVTAYRVLRHGSVVAEVPTSTSTHTFEQLVPEASYGFAVEAGDAAGNWSTDGPQASVVLPAPVLPPDPAVLAPPLPVTSVVTVDSALAFLHTGPDAIQKGVAPGAIEQHRTAAVRGRITTRAGDPLAGVQVTCVGELDLGTTYTRPDGWYDFVLNGGGRVTLRFRKAGYVTAQRGFTIPWQRQNELESVVLLPYDPAATAMDLAQPGMKVHQATLSSDSDGTRRATLLFEEGTTVDAVLEDGSLVPLPSITVRATEYTIGANGPNAMVAELPPISSYTYAAELSVDEAEAIGAVEVRFSQQALFYLENYRGFPVGMAVPIGYYDRERTIWYPAPDGRVIEIVGVSAGDGLAEVDSDGDGAPDDPAELLMSDAELSTLAGLYPIGTELWRMPLQHFTPCDPNLSSVLPDGSSAPGNGTGPGNTGNTGNNGSGENSDCEGQGSIIKIASQRLRESVRITGTPYAVHYSSDRVPEYAPGDSLDIALTTSDLLPDLMAVHLQVTAGGRITALEFGPEPDQSYTWTYDGRDSYGRDVVGPVEVEVRLGYEYPALYALPFDPELGWTSFLSTTGLPIPDTPSDRSAILWTTWTRYLGASPPTLAGDVETPLHGWSFSPHHVYDPLGRRLLRGDGTTVQAVGSAWTISEAAGDGIADCQWQAGTTACGNLGPASQASIGRVTGMAFEPDGKLRIEHHFGVSHILPDGTIRRYAPQELRERSIPGPDGWWYRLENQQVSRYRFGDAFNQEPIAGSGFAGGDTGDGGPAVDSLLSLPTKIAFGPDGSLYILQGANPRIRRITGDGIINNYAGGGDLLPTPEGVPVHEARFVYIDDGMVFTPDGSLIFAMTDGLFAVRPHGIVQRIAGGGSSGLPEDGDWLPALEAHVNARHLAVDQDGTIFFSHESRIRALGSDGIIRPVAGNGQACDHLLAPCGEQGPAETAPLSCRQFTSGPDGLYCASQWLFTVRRIAPRFPALQQGTMLVADPRGDAVHIFSRSGQHLQTMDPMSGSLIREFQYDAEGRLAAVVEADGQQTTFVRDAAGTLAQLVPPSGQATAVQLTPDGDLWKVIRPDGQETVFTYGSGSLLTSMTDPLGHTHTYTYGPNGALLQDENATGGVTTLTAQVSDQGEWQIVLDTSEGTSRTFTRGPTATGGQAHSNQAAGGGTRSSTWTSSGERTTTLEDGSQVTVAESPDPRHGMQAAFIGHILLTLPSGLTWEYEHTRQVTMASSDDPLSTLEQIDTFVINGTATSVTQYDATTGVMTMTSPEGRVHTLRSDASGRITSSEAAGRHPIEVSYGADGKPDSMTRGDRIVTFEYDADGRLWRVTDPLLRTLEYSYDLAGNISEVALPDGAVLGKTIDAAGNVVAVQPPGRPWHIATYDDDNRLTGYTPPGPAGVGSFDVAWDLDGRLDTVTYADGSGWEMGWNPLGQLVQLQTSRGVTTFGQDPVTGLETTATTPEGNTVAFGYDGFLTTDLTWTGLVAGTVSFTWDSFLRPDSVAVNGDGRPRGYDVDGLLTSVGALALTRDPLNGQLSGATIGGITTSWEASPYGELSSYRVDGAGGQAYYAGDYTYDALGRLDTITEVVDGGPAVELAFAYDAQGRLASRSVDALVAESAVWDANGAWTSVTDVAGTRAVTVDDADRVTLLGAIAYGYDVGGRRASRTSGGDVTAYRWDSLGNLMGADLPDGTAIDYVYDGLNQRIAKKVDGAVTQGFLWRDPLSPIAELDAAGAVVSRFVYGEAATTPAYIEKGGATYRLVLDHRQSVRLVVDVDTGAVVQRLDYDAFGRVLTDTNPGFQPFGFAGGLYDADLGWVTFGVRHYDPETGSWTRPDPIGFAGGVTNLYLYAGGDPMNRIDPDGRFAHIVGGAIIGAVVGGAIAGAATAMTGGSAEDVAAAALGGAVSGAITGGLTAAIGPAGLTVGGAMAVGAGANVAGALVTAGAQALGPCPPTAGQVATNVGLAAASGLAGGALGGALDDVAQRLGGQALASAQGATQAGASTLSDLGMGLTTGLGESVSQGVSAAAGGFMNR